MNPIIWSPQPADMASSHLQKFLLALVESGKISKPVYKHAWYWSTENTADFWAFLADYFELNWTPQKVLSGKMPDCQWFEGVKLNYAQEIFRRNHPDQIALIAWNEAGLERQYTWREMETYVAQLIQFFKKQGVKKGDRVVGYLGNTPEASIAWLATTALGAIWSSASPDFGQQSVLDRFGQIEPVLLIASSKYQYGGKSFDRTEVVQSLVQGLPTVQTVLVLEDESSISDAWSWREVFENQETVPLEFTPVDFMHPMWVLYSSGTTGMPKAITHSQGGMLLEHLKYVHFHADVRAGERFFWYTTTGWMMWNFIHATWLAGATILLYDGNPAYPSLDHLWEQAEQYKIQHFGTSAAYILACLKAGISPKNRNLTSLRQVSSTGSPLPAEGFDWIYQEVKSDVWLTSMSGGTDVCTAFVGGNPLLPVHQGEIQCATLGCSLYAVTESGAFVQGEVGEMVITQPMPCMPVFFWNDPDKIAYQEAYFSTYPGWWRHGDWVITKPNMGLEILGRSDATLNRFGIRIGTSEIYRSVEKLEMIQDSLVVNIEAENGESTMWLFVQLKGSEYSPEQLKKEVSKQLRQDYSPRHVPDHVVIVPAIPYTISGKKMELPVKKILKGIPIEQAATAGAMRNPESLVHYVPYAIS